MAHAVARAGKIELGDLSTLVRERDENQSHRLFAVPPFGPAIPVIPTPMDAPERARTPSASAWATGWRLRRGFQSGPRGTPANRVFNSLA